MRGSVALLAQFDREADSELEPEDNLLYRVFIPAVLLLLLPTGCGVTLPFKGPSLLENVISISVSDRSLDDSSIPIQILYTSVPCCYCHERNIDIAEDYVGRRIEVTISKRETIYILRPPCTSPDDSEESTYTFRFQPRLEGEHVVLANGVEARFTVGQ